MCGFTAIYHSNNYLLDINEFSKINDSLVHRGPDSSGIKELDLKNYRLKLGFRRLSILDLSTNGNQPMTDEEKNLTLLFNGEIYNHNDLRKELEINFNCKWKGTSDSETLLKLLKYYKIETVLNKVEGMFAFLLYSKKDNKLIFCRDKVGEKPLYISTNKNYIGISSDLKSLKKFPNFQSKLSQKSMTNFFNLNYIPYPETIFLNCFKLPPASYIEINLNNFKLNEFLDFNNFINSKGVNYYKWWNFKYKKNFEGKSMKEVNTKIENLLINSIEKKMLSDVSLGAFLSSGIDSALIVALMKTLDSNISTFTIGYEYSDYDESNDAKKIAKHLGTNHNTFICTKKETIDVIKDLQNVYSEPFADSSQIPTYLISKFTKEKVTVSLSGDGGDELFGGYNRYLLANKYWKYIKIIPPQLRAFILNMLNYIPEKLILSFLKKINLNLSGDKNKNYNKIIEKIGLMKNEESLYNSMINQWYDKYELYKNKNLQMSQYSTVFNLPDSFKIEEKMMHYDFLNYLSDDILCKVDRSSMFHSLESRSPFLDTNIIEYATSLPLKFKINNGKSKIVLRNILMKYIPQNLTPDTKKGFAIPISEWMRTDLKDFVNDNLNINNISQLNFLDSNVVQKIKNDHFESKSNNEHKLWSLIQFNQWYYKNKALITE